MADIRKKYSREFKLEAVRMLEAGEKTDHEIEAELGIGSGQGVPLVLLLCNYGWSEMPFRAALAGAKRATTPKISWVRPCS